MSDGRKYFKPGEIPSSVGLRLELPKIDEEILKDPSRLDEVVELKMTAVNQIQKSITDALGWLSSVTIWLALCQPDPKDSAEDRAKKALKYRVSKDTIAKDQEKVFKYLDDCLSHEDPIYKTAAVISYLNYNFGQEFATKEDATEMLRGLEARSLLVKDANGPIHIGYDRYSASAEFGIEQEDLVLIQTAVAKFSRNLLKLTKQQREEKTAEIRQEANLSLKQFLDGVQGKFMLEIPGEQKEDGSWFRGGNLLLEVRGREILPISCSGSIEGTVFKMIELDVRLGHYTLQWDTVPGYGKSAFTRVKEGIMKTRDVSDQEAETILKKMQSLWYLITRGLDAKINETEMNQLREEYTKKATITPVQFFGLNGSGCLDGIAFLEFEGAFKTKSGEVIHNVFLLVERLREENPEPVLKVLDAPPRVKELLDSLSLQGQFEEGENFSKLPLTLQRILRAIRSKTDLNVEVAKDA